ncbi:MAG: Rrf2 family transcriptional regulator [Bryobacterales bacterium]|nr:Rrf2 family transcriptional regulator [Bryobacterales bacterium]
MHLTLHTDYAFRTLMFVAVRTPAPATIQEISAHYGISRGHLMVLVNRLGNARLLDNQRGRGGGIRLARPATEIRLGEIVTATEPHFHIVECFNPEANQCLITSPCRLRGILQQALGAWLDVLNSYTLADLVKRNAGLKDLLHQLGPNKLSEPVRSRSDTAGRRQQ